MDARRFHGDFVRSAYHCMAHGLRYSSTTTLRRRIPDRVRSRQSFRAVGHRGEVGVEEQLASWLKAQWVPTAVLPAAADIVEITDAFCAEHLDPEYAEL